MTLKMPSVIVDFKEKGITAIQRSQRGIVALVLIEDSAELISVTNIYTADDVPETLSEFNQEQINLCLIGYQNTPRAVKAVVVPKSTEITAVQKYLESVRFDYVVVPTVTAEETTVWATWIKGMRTVKDVRVKAVLPNCSMDTEGVVNFTNSVIKTAAKAYTAAEYCSRVAGIICGTPATIACTYAPAPELIEVESNTAEERDERVGRGEFFFWNDGEKIKVARGVNSFVTTVQGKGEDYQFIKLIDLMDMIHDDIVKTGHDSYIGKYANSYDNRMLLVSAIQGYIMQLEIEGLLEKGENTVEIDIERTKAWLLSNGKYTKDELAEMSDLQIKKANIHTNVFIKADLSLLNAIENITVNANIA